MNMYGNRRTVTWKLPSISADGLKNFACITMLIHTIGIAIVENGLIHLDQYTQAELSSAMAEDSRLMMYAGIGSVMQLVGGLAVPIFAFLLVEGFLHTSDFKKYLLSMLGFALISEIPYDLAMSQRFFDWSGQNALFTMGICLLMLYFLKMLDGRKGIAFGIAKCMIVLCALFWVTLFRAQGGLCIVLLCAVFYVWYAKNVRKTVLGILISLLYVTGPISFYGIWCYNEERKDRLPKYAYYAFYPLHLLILGVIATFFMAG